MNNKLRFFLTSLFILFVVALRAAATGDIRVSGVVMSEGEPLPGASVLVKGTHNGTVTDVDGRYTRIIQGMVLFQRHSSYFFYGPTLKEFCPDPVKLFDVSHVIPRLYGVRTKESFCESTIETGLRQ